MNTREKPFLLVQIDPPTEEFCGDHYYRTYVPLFVLGNQSASFYTVSLTNEHRLKFKLLETADVVVLNLIADMDLIPFVEERRKKGLVTIYEWNDDVYNVPPWNPQYRFFSQPHVRSSMKKLARLCDAVQFSSPALEENYGWLNEKRIVFINHLLPLFDRSSLYRDGDPVEIGYGGSAGHFYDVRSIASYISDWLHSEEKARLNIMAGRPIVELFSSAPPDRIKVFPTGSIFDYYSFLSNLHIGLAPLLDTPFNRSRSDVKFLEYAFFGIVPVLQKTGPYLDVVIDGKTGFLFENADECISILSDLLSSSYKMKTVAREARNYVLRERMMSQHVEERERFYLKLIKKDISENHGAYRLFSKLRNLEGARSYGDYIMLTPTIYETLLREGLCALSEGDTAKAGECFHKASMMGDHYLPYLYLSECIKERDGKLQCLNVALKLNPRSITAKWILERLRRETR